MAAHAALQVDGRAITSHLDRSVQKANDLAEHVDPLGETIMDCATHFERGNNADRVDAARKVLAELITLETNIKAHAQAFSHLAQIYRPAIDSNTDFSALVEEHCAAHAVECQPQQDERYRDLEKKVWEVHHAGEPMPGGSGAAAHGGDDDDDIILEGGASDDLSKNPRCPITLKDVLELKEPVEDALGFVYEREAIMDWFKLQQGRDDTPVEAPFAATNHMISKATLKKAAKVIREQRRRQRRGGQTEQARADDAVLDV